jgi:hypothetical protein
MRVKGSRRTVEEALVTLTITPPAERTVEPTAAGPLPDVAPYLVPVTAERLGWRARRAERRRLKQLDALAARLGELQSMTALLERSAEVIRGGWVQGAWFTVRSPGGAKAVTAYNLRHAVDQEVTGACLVGAVVHAAGGPSTVRTQLVQRTLDLLWHTLREDSGRAVRWCPGPRVRMMQVLDLTHWNDASHRKQRQVVDLLVSARHSAVAQREATRAELVGAQR